MQYLPLAISLVSLIVACLFFLRNEPHREGINRALGTLAIPERMFGGYTANELQAIVDRLRQAPAPGGRTQLDAYVRPVLYWNDIVFAIALAVFSASLWYWVLGMIQPSGCWRCLLIALTTSAVLYGVTDVAEDVLLARLFAKPRIAPREAWVACQMTRIKIVTNGLSLTAALVFGVLSYHAKQKAKG